jgi:hypothetical protein
LIVDELEPNDGLAHETELAGGPRSLNGQLSIRPATRIGIRTTSPISMPYISRLVIAL